MQMRERGISRRRVFYAEVRFLREQRVFDAQRAARE